MKKVKTLILLALLIVSLIPLANLGTPGLPETHDGQDHVARIANFYQSFSEGNLIPRWAANLNWGYGHPILMFLYPLPSYFASLFHAIGFSFVDSTKLVFAAAYLGSIFAMYLWLRSQWGVAPGFVGAVLYGLAPYRFVDLYVRGAIGEHVAFVFPPFILWGLWQIAHKQSRFSGVLTALATAGLILSHNAISLMFLPIIVLYLLYLLYFEVNNKSKFLALSVWFIVLGFLLSAFFWVPAFFEGKYTLRDIVTKGEFGERFVPWNWFISSRWNYGGGNQFTKELGSGQWISILGSVALFLFQKKKSFRIFLGGSLVILLVSLYLMTNTSSAVWQTVTLLQKFQFPWRLLSVGVFITSVLGAVVIANVPKKLTFFVSIVFIFVSFMSTSHMWKAKAYVIKPELFYTDIYEGTTDTGESSPIWSVRFMEERPSVPIEVIEGKALLEQGLRTTTKRQYTVQTQTSTRLVENTLYFPGWQVFVDGKPTIVEFQDPAYRGLMTFWVDPGEHQVTIIFGDTKLRLFANMISLVGIILLIFSFYAKALRR